MVPGDAASGALLTFQYDIASIFARARSASEGLSRALGTIVHKQGWDVGIAWLADGENFRHVAHYAQPGMEAAAVMLRQSLENEPRRLDTEIIAALAADGGVCRCRETAGCGAVCVWRKAAAQSGMAYAMAVPLASAGTVYGLLELFNHDAPATASHLERGLLAVAADLGQYLRARRREGRQRSRNARLVEAQRIARLAYWECSPSSGRLRSAGNFWEVLGLADHELPDTLDEYLKLVPEEEQPRLQAALAKLLDSRVGHIEFEHSVVAPYRDERVVVIRALADFDANGKPHRLSGTLQDITSYRHLEGRLRLAATAIDHAGDAIVIFDARGVIMSTNPAFTRITGYSEDEVRGHQLDALLNRPSGRHDESFYRRILGRLRTFGRWKGELWGRAKDGRDFAMLLSLNVIRDAVGRVTNHVGVFTDVSRQKKYKEHLEQLALHDSLTGLPNRALFLDRGQQSLALSARTGLPVGLIFIDLDLFKSVNDQYGHAVGDEVLRQAGARMRDIMRDCDTVARLGGDEFVVLLTDVTGKASCVSAAERLIESLSAPYYVNEQAVNVGASLGIAISPAHGEDIETLLHHADQALYSIKRDTDRRYAVWMPELGGTGLPRTMTDPPLLQRGEAQADFTR